MHFSHASRVLYRKQILHHLVCLLSCDKERVRVGASACVRLRVSTRVSAMAVDLESMGGSTRRRLAGTVERTMRWIRSPRLNLRALEILGLVTCVCV